MEPRECKHCGHGESYNSSETMININNDYYCIACLIDVANYNEFDDTWELV